MQFPKIREIKFKKIFNTATLVIAIFIACIIAYFKFGFYHLSQFDTADEHLWMISERIQETDSWKPLIGRISKYWISAANKDWPDTRINDKPGVSLAYVSGLGFLFEKSAPDIIKYKGTLFTSYDTEAAQQLMLIFRRPLIIFNGLFSIFFLSYFWRLTRNKWLSLVASVSILLCPVLVGMSQIVNPDTLLWPFSFASILAFFVFMREGKFIDAFLSAIFLGFALLSKYVALILLPFYLIMALTYLFFEYENLEKDNILVKRMRQLFIGCPIIIAGGIGLYALLMPAMLVNTKLLYAYTFGFGKGAMESQFLYLFCLNGFLIIDSIFFKAFITKWLMKKLQFIKLVLPRLLYLSLAASFIFILVNFTLKNNFLNIDNVNFEASGKLSSFFLEIVAPQISPLIFSLIPIVLFLILFLWIKSIFRRSIFDYMVFALSLFLVIYYFAMIKQGVPLNVRYSIMLYPIAITLAGFGFYELVSLFKLKEWGIAILALIVIFLSGMSLWKIRPFYFNYTSNLIPKQYSYSKLWGFGGYEAAQFVNDQMKDVENPVVWSDYDGFCPFFRGECVIPLGPKWASEGRLRKIDYYVLTYQGQKKNKPSLKALQEISPKSELVWELYIDGRTDNYVRVYKVIHEDTVNLKTDKKSPRK